MGDGDRGTFLFPHKGSNSPPIYFDCVLTEQVTRDAEITEFPVEVGANISDHYRVKLNEVRLEVFVSQEPLDYILDGGDPIHPEGQGFWGAQSIVTKPYPSQSVGAGVAKAILNPVGSVTSLVGAQFDSFQRPVVFTPVLQWAAPFDSLQNLLEKLDAIRSAAGLVDIYTKSAVYQSFALAQIITHRDKETGSGTRVSLEFKSIVTVSTQQVAWEPTPVKPKDKKPVNKGAQQPTEPKQQSALSAIVDLFKSTGGGP